MKEEILTYIILGIGLINLSMAYINWSRYTRNTYLSKSHNEEYLKKTAKKVGMFSAISGVSLGFLGILARNSTYQNASDKIGIFLSIPIALMFGLIWTLFYLGGFLLKAYTLKSIYKETETD